jgi:phospholipid-binding lipoprotein MlaA
MRMSTTPYFLVLSLGLTACAQKSTNPDDPFESVNRKTYAFNHAVDTVVFKPPAVIYKTLVPALVRNSVNNFYNNIYLMPTVANDLLQVDGRQAIKDTWRFIANTTIGVGGLFDVATGFGLPHHKTDLGVTFAKWGYKKSAYLMLPLLGPTTVRDGIGMGIEYTFVTPYFYLHDDALIYALIGLRFVDLRSQWLETDKLMDEALDPYAFLRDAYLQNRQFLITGTTAVSNDLYVEE